MAEAVWGDRPLSARRLLSLIVHLPPGNATAIALGKAAPGWGNTEELLAVLAEVVDAHHRSFMIVHSKKGAPRPTPIRIARPAALRPPRRPATSEDLREMFGGSARYVPVDAS